MKKFIPANFKPLDWPRASPQQLRAQVLKQPTRLALPGPDRLARVLSGLLVFLVLI